MTFWLEDALSSAAVPSRRNQFMIDILETQFPGVHVDVDDDVGLPEDAKGDSSTARSREDGYCSTADGTFGEISHSQYLEYLHENGPNFLMKNLKDKEMICSMLLDMAEHVKVLTPADDPLPWDILNMSLWKASLCELIKEMKTVQEKCLSLICNSAVYVLTTSPYAAFLRALAAEIADRRS